MDEIVYVREHVVRHVSRAEAGRVTTRSRHTARMRRRPSTLPKTGLRGLVRHECLTEPQCGNRPRPDPHEAGATRGRQPCDHPAPKDLHHRGRARPDRQQSSTWLLARLPDAPPGVKGISRSSCPSSCRGRRAATGCRAAAQRGSPAARIEEKMGIHAAATCVMNSTGATGLAGPSRAPLGPAGHVS